MIRDDLNDLFRLRIAAQGEKGNVCVGRGGDWERGKNGGRNLCLSPEGACPCT